MIFKYTLGLSYILGKAEDNDGDGIVNSKDECPNVAGLAAFTGCPDAARIAKI